MNSRNTHVSDPEIIKEFHESEDAFLTAAELSERFCLTRQAINNRLKQLHNDGVLKKKRAGSRAVGWWLAED